MGGGASKKKSGPNPFAKETKPEQRASADSVDDDDEEVPLPQSKFAGAGDSVFFNRKELARRGINVEKDLDGKGDDEGEGEEA